MPKMMTVTRITAGRRRQMYVAIAVSRANAQTSSCVGTGPRQKGAESDLVIRPICQAINPPNGLIVQISCELEVWLVADWEIEHDARA